MKAGVETLGNGCYVAVDTVHRFGTDAFLLADFCAAGPGETAADIGTGCGIIPMIWLKNGRCAQICGVELQPEAAALARKSAAVSNGTERFRVICDDIRNHRSFWIAGSFDLISCNPPYQKSGAGLRSVHPARATARHEGDCTLEDICAAARYGLRWGGRLCLCHRPERLTDVMTQMRAQQLEPKRLRTVCQRPGEEPWLILIEGRRGGKSGLKILPPFYMEAPDGSPSAELRILYSGGEMLR